LSWCVVDHNTHDVVAGEFDELVAHRRRPAPIIRSRGRTRLLLAEEEESRGLLRST
jgi:hypothetical protein